MVHTYIYINKCYNIRAARHVIGFIFCLQLISANANAKKKKKKIQILRAYCVHQLHCNNM